VLPLYQSTMGVQMLTVPELKALAVGMDLKLGSRNSSNRQAMLAWYSRTLLSPSPGSTVSSCKRASCCALLQPNVWRAFSASGACLSCTVPVDWRTGEASGM
jgi:hypothetical protein